MTRIRWVCALLVGLTVAAATPRPSSAQQSMDVTAQDRTVAVALAGCYDLLVGTWSQPLRRGPATAPSQIRLDSILLERLNGQRRFMPRSSVRARRRRAPVASPPRGGPSEGIPCRL